MLDPALLFLQFLNLSQSVAELLLIYVVRNIVLVELVFNVGLFLEEPFLLVLIDLVVEFELVTNTDFLDSVFEFGHELTIRLAQIVLDSVDIYFEVILLF